MTFYSYLLLAIPLAPLVGALSAGLLGRKLGHVGAHRVAILGVALAFLLSAIVFFKVLRGAGYHVTIYQWLRTYTSTGALKFEIGFLVDSLTALMMCIVTFVSLMVHFYAIGYMKDDPGYQRFFSYISLFTFSMLMLVMSNNFLQLFFGWEAVGLISYLLIGFWYTKPTAIYANLKAFLVNRVGDLGFVLGIGLLVAHAGSLNYSEIFAQREVLAKLTFSTFDFVETLGLPEAHWRLLTVACLCLFIGAMGKSAQFPLHVWLPNSMEGPTPISALIHAATMVTAGIFMVARMSPLFELSDNALSFMMVIGAMTALLMGLLGLVQNDIKRVIAYSTLSQLGYMTVALGASAYSAAIFHLMTHAFFKALLFLAAGSVIIGMHHEQDMRKMGGLYKIMPVTWLTSLIGALALIGTPFFSGFYSKDSIIEAVGKSHLAGAGFAYFAVVISVFITALYTFRMFFLVFHGEARFRTLQPHGHSASEPHESPWVITLPLILLALPSIGIGALAVGPMLYGDFFSRGLAFHQVISVSDAHLALHEMSQNFDGWLGMAMHAVRELPAWFALAGVIVAWLFHLKRLDIGEAIRQYFPRLYALLAHQYYMDKLNEFLFARGALALGTKLWKTSDQAVIDRLVNGSASLVGRLAAVTRLLQTGYLYHYAFAMMIGLLALLTGFVVFNGK